MTLLQIMREMIKKGYKEDKDSKTFKLKKCKVATKKM